MEAPEAAEPAAQFRLARLSRSVALPVELSQVTHTREALMRPDSERLPLSCEVEAEGFPHQLAFGSVFLLRELLRASAHVGWE